MRGANSFLILVATLLVFDDGVAQRKLSFEFGTGYPLNMPLPLTILQSGQPDIHLNAHYNSEPFAVPISWDWRVAYWSENSAWELEAIHHKLFLENKPQDVQEFAISHGLNVVTINRVWYSGSWLLRAGAGVSLTHPETTIRGRTLPQTNGIFHIGYYVSGPAITIAAGKRFILAGGLFISPEGKLFASYSSVPIQDGAANVWQLTVQAGLILGYEVEL